MSENPRYRVESITAIIITYNSARYIRECLQALKRAGIRDIRVWDNNSTDDTCRVVAALEDTYIVLHRSPANLGFGVAINRATRLTPLIGPILLVNPDCIIGPDVPASLLSVLDTDANAGIVAPGMMYPNGQMAISAGPLPTLSKELLARARIDERMPAHVKQFVESQLRRAGIGKRFTDFVDGMTDTSIRQFDWVSGFCMLIRPEAWTDTGGFDERIFLYFEDVALCRAATAKGWKILRDGRVTATHDESASSSNAGKSYHYYTGMWGYFAIYGKPAQRRTAEFVLARRDK